MLRVRASRQPLQIRSKLSARASRIGAVAAAAEPPLLALTVTAAWLVLFNRLPSRRYQADLGGSAAQAGVQLAASQPCCRRPSLNAASTSSTLEGLAL